MLNTVSVIITTYNRPHDLCRAVKSVIAQTVSPLEILVINDGDPSSFHIEDQLSDRIALYHTGSQKGANYARNMGAHIAKGDTLMFLDDDDTWSSDKIEKQLQVFTSNPKVGLVYSGKNVVFDENGDVIQYKIPCTQSGNIYPGILEQNFIGTTSSVAVIKEVFDDAGGFDESLPAMQDYDLWIRVCRLAEVAADGGFHVNYTVNRSGKNQISNSGYAQLEAAEIILSKYSSEFEKYGISLKKRKARFYFYVAKSIRKNSLRNSLEWIGKSFILDPSLRTLYLLVSSERII